VSSIRDKIIDTNTSPPRSNRYDVALHPAFVISVFIAKLFKKWSYELNVTESKEDHLLRIAVRTQNKIVFDNQICTTLLENFFAQLLRFPVRDFGSL
jgi:hypothetical protein